MSTRAVVPGERDLFDLHRRFPEDFPLLLQSVAAHPESGRYDLLFAFPEPVALAGRDPFALLDAVQAQAGPLLPAQDLPFVGGWFFLLGYESARWVEPGLRLPASPHGLPDALLVRCPAALIYDRDRQVCTLVAERGEADLQRLRAALADRTPLPPLAEGSLIEPLEEEPGERYEAGVRRILDYLRAGDIFQANLSRAWRGRLRAGADYPAVYAALRRHNPGPFAGLLAWQGLALLSSSPERLMRLDQGWAETRPIAGTRPRGATPAEDERLERSLIGSLKERAEHVMLIDLERNDLGRVCVPGSVTVSELMRLERYAHVHHIVSNVRGRLRAGIGPGSALRAVFPGGTITGCPKVRAMEIIAELEAVGRGPYTGTLGYLSRCGRLDSNILIRSLVCEGRAISFRAGAGIVADSDPAHELAETRSKARGLRLALEQGR